MTDRSPQYGAISTPGPGTYYLRPELKDLKIIGVEEHGVFHNLQQRVPNSTEPAQLGRDIYSKLYYHGAMGYAAGRSDDLKLQRIKDMDKGGVAMQVLSSVGSVYSTHIEDPEAALRFAHDVNDELKKAVDAHPERFKAFAEVPAQVPELAIKELRRCVQELGFVGGFIAGSVGGTRKFLDDPEFDGLLTEFETLNIPLFLHPAVAPKPVINAYYTFPGKPLLTATLSGMGWGWHNEVAVHVLRLGVSDRHRGLKIIIGHQGEMLPMMMQRFDVMFPPELFGLQRTVGQILREQVWVAISGMFTIPPTLAAVQTWGVDHVLFANDYPFLDLDRTPNFINALGDVIAPSDLRKICQTNAEELFRIKL
ncbi:hypothetical protein B7463_g7625, partial [Scytalidium lignicola]